MERGPLVSGKTIFMKRAAGWEGAGQEGTWTEEMPILPWGQGCLQAAGVGGLFL